MHIISHVEKDNNVLITSVEALSKQLLKQSTTEIPSSHSLVPNCTANQILGSSLNDGQGKPKKRKSKKSRELAKKSKPSAPAPTDPIENDEIVGNLQRRRMKQAEMSKE